MRSQIRAPKSIKVNAYNKSSRSLNSDSSFSTNNQTIYSGFCPSPMEEKLSDNDFTYTSITKFSNESEEIISTSTDNLSFQQFSQFINNSNNNDNDNEDFFNSTQQNFFKFPCSKVDNHKNYDAGNFSKYQNCLKANLDSFTNLNTTDKPEFSGQENRDNECDFIFSDNLVNHARQQRRNNFESIESEFKDQANRNIAISEISEIRTTRVIKTNISSLSSFRASIERCENPFLKNFNNNVNSDEKGVYMNTEEAVTFSLRL